MLVLLQFRDFILDMQLASFEGSDLQFVEPWMGLRLLDLALQRLVAPFEAVGRLGSVAALLLQPGEAVIESLGLTVDGTLAGRSPRHAVLMDADGLGDLPSNPAQRIEGGHRVLEDHRHRATAQAAQLTATEVGELNSVEAH